jgi:hypothetical protein
MATLALMLQVQAGRLEAAVIATVFGVGATLVLFVWLAFVQREGRLQTQVIVRMRELESQLAFRRQDLLRGSQVTDASTGLIASVTDRWFLSVDQTSVLTGTARIVAIGWLTVVVWRWLIWAGAFA